MFTQQQLIAELKKLCDEIIAIAEAKNSDYSRGEDAFKNLRRHGIYGIVVRLDDKISRLDSLTNPKHADNDPRVKGESVDDTFFDTATYSLLAITLRRVLAQELTTTKDTTTVGQLAGSGRCL